MPVLFLSILLNIVILVAIICFDHVGVLKSKKNEERRQTLAMNWWTKRPSSTNQIDYDLATVKLPKNLSALSTIQDNGNDNNKKYKSVSQQEERTKEVEPIQIYNFEVNVDQRTSLDDVLRIEIEEINKSNNSTTNDEDIQSKLISVDSLDVFSISLSDSKLIGIERTNFDQTNDDRLEGSEFVKWLPPGALLVAPDHDTTDDQRGDLLNRDVSETSKDDEKNQFKHNEKQCATVGTIP